MKKWPNIGDRITERLLALGFRRVNGKPDVMGFSFRNGWNHVYLFRWIGGSTPDYDNIIKLSAQLEVSPSWLMFGEQGTQVPSLAGESKPPARKAGRSVGVPIGSAAVSPAPRRVERAKGPKGEKGHYVNSLRRAA
jgi:hypothetical protein